MRPTSSGAETGAEHLDVVVVGAGLSGIGAAYRLSTECPWASFAVLEAREAIGGTWDLFRYPGVRSDSDMFTLGYEFKPWRAAKAIADGDTILSYIHETAREFDLDKHVRLSTRLLSADWSSAEQHWRLELETPSGSQALTCGFLYACSGYYDYSQGHDPQFEGTDDFAGDIVHPQFWPEDFDYTGKRVVVVGSGATAMTLVPAMAPDAAHVTMLQRSPTWVGSLPAVDRVADRLRATLPASVAHRLIRVKNIVRAQGFYEFCRRFPEKAQSVILRQSAKEIGSDVVREHFTPSYIPWEQRFCFVPDGDLFRAIRDGRADVVTDHVERFVPEGLLLRSGRVLEADVVVTATGLKVQLFGGAAITLDGHQPDLHEEYVWSGAMISGLPNFALCVGYTNASWTLRADLTHRLVCRVLKHMHDRGYAVAEAVPDDDIEPHPLLDLSSGYIARAAHQLPRQGHRGSWKMVQNYAIDTTVTMRRRLESELSFSPPVDAPRSA